MAATIQTLDAVLKQHYTKDRVLDMVYKDNPLFALTPKMTEFGGRNLPVPIVFGE